MLLIFGSSISTEGLTWKPFFPSKLFCLFILGTTHVKLTCDI
jgi:hypothetical protein